MYSILDQASKYRGYFKSIFLYFRQNLRLLPVENVAARKATREKLPKAENKHYIRGFVRDILLVPQSLQRARGPFISYNWSLWSSQSQSYYSVMVSFYESSSPYSPSLQFAQKQLEKHGWRKGKWFQRPNIRYYVTNSPIKTFRNDLLKLQFCPTNWIQSVAEYTQ